MRILIFSLKSLFIIAVACTIVPFTVSYVFAASSVNIPLDSSAYRDLETLSARHVIQSDLSSTKPYTRNEAGRLIFEAIDALEKNQYSLQFSSEKILEQLKNDYQDEINEARAKSSSKTFLKPIDNFSVKYNYLSGPFSIYNNEGINYFDGHNAQASFQSFAKLWNVFSFYVQPVILYNQKANNVDGNSETDVRMHKGYVKFTLSNFEIQAGRDSLWWGPGYHGALLMSNNAKPFDMIKVSNPEAVLLPWIFKYLGPIKFNLIFSQLNDERTAPALSKPYLYGLRLDLKPHPLFEIGISQLCLFSGEGRRNLSFNDIVKILYSNENRDNSELDSNQEVAIDVAFTIPNVQRLLPLASSIKIYGEVGAEDTGLPPDRRAYLVGAAFSDFLLFVNMKFRVEYANLSPSSVPNAWYSHSSYPMQYEGRVFGHHAGGDSDDLFFELSQDHIGKWSYQLGFDKERSGLNSKTNIQDKYQFYVGMGYELMEKSKVMVKYAYEKIKNYNYVADDTRNNHFVGVEFTAGF